MIGRAVGRVLATRGGLIEAELPCARVGDGVRVCSQRANVAARVAAIDATRALLAPLGVVDRIAAGDHVEVDPSVLRLPLGTPLLGRAIDPDGTPLDARAYPRGRRIAAGLVSRNPGERRACDALFTTGVRAIDGPLAIGRGGRIGIFGEPGAGKSTLLDAIVRGADADAVVIALAGERGREAQQRISTIDARTTIVCATGDRSASERLRAAEIAFAQAESLCSRGLDVLLVVDSLARVCAAARELAVAAGEPAGRGGYPPSVFALMAGLVERAGAFANGTITLIATVLSDGPDQNDPVSEAARAALDGHLVLSARLARAGRFPAIDVVRSASRTLSGAAPLAHREAAATLRAALAVLDETHDARSLGIMPADPFHARCVDAEGEIERFLRQGGESSGARDTLTELLRLADTLQNGRLR